ncbi:MAG: PLP-dependent aminotransferase family protein [Alphaproteobacteria bacterium]|nr:PLP-dependent aminotransferase family protein [Alphaproteobacteria bacterium]
MSRSDYVPALPPPSGQPLFIEIARAITEDIRRGRLQPGDRLPGTRRLARALGVHRTTAVAACDELASEGWIETRPGSGSFVRADLPEAPAPPGHRPLACGFPLPPPPARLLEERPTPPGALEMLGGHPDLRLLPLTELARAYRRVLRGRGRRLVDYGSPRGQLALRVQLARWLNERRGLSLGPESLLVTRGAQMDLFLLGRCLLQPGDRVGVEALGYPPAWEALRLAGATLVPLPVDAEGVDVDALERLGPLKAIYVTPHHQYPTGVTLSAARRLRLLRLAAERRFAILEDDYDHEFHYRGRPVLPLASADSAGVVVSIGTLSKAFAPGLRLGWIAGPPALIDRACALRMVVDRQGDHVVEQAVAELLADGVIQRHGRRMQRVYRARQQALAEGVRSHLGGRLAVDPPAGGLALWARILDGADPRAWADRARARGVVIQPGPDFHFAGESIPFLRLGFAGLDRKELDEALRRLAAAR